MVDSQIRPSDVTKFPIIQAMLDIPREAFVPVHKREIAYIGDHLPIGKDRFILDPRIMAKMLDSLNIRKNELVLDVGSGLGYSCAIIAAMAEVVVALEEVEQFVKEAEETLFQHSVDNVITVHGSLTEGYKKYGPFDVIICQGAVEILPDALHNQLKEGGRIGMIKVTDTGKRCMIGFKESGLINWVTAFDAEAPVLKGFEKEIEFEF